MQRRGLLFGAVAVAALAAVGAATVPAAAAQASAESLSTIQAQAAAAIALRVNDLNAATTKVRSDSDLGTDGPGLVAYLQKDVVPLQQLGQTIAAATNAAEARMEAATIFTDFRVLALVLPASRLADASDDINDATLPRLTALASRATSRENPGDQSTLAPLLADVDTLIKAASSATSVVATTVLGYIPAQWNANHSLLGSPRSSVAAANADIKEATADLKQVDLDLKAERQNGAPGTAPSTG